MTAPSRAQIHHATQVIAAAANAGILPRWAYTHVAQINLALGADARALDGFERFAAMAMPWVPEHAPDMANMRAAWLAGVEWARSQSTFDTAPSRVSCGKPEATQ